MTYLVDSKTEWQQIYYSTLFQELNELFRRNSIIISDCQVSSFLKTLTGCRIKTTKRIRILCLDIYYSSCFAEYPLHPIACYLPRFSTSELFFSASWLVSCLWALSIQQKSPIQIFGIFAGRMERVRPLPRIRRHVLCNTGHAGWNCCVWKWWTFWKFSRLWSSMTVKQ